jgi:hypothetical protein
VSCIVSSFFSRLWEHASQRTVGARVRVGSAGYTYKKQKKNKQKVQNKQRKEKKRKERK